MNKTLFKSIREYKKQSLLAPFLVILEVLMEVLIPLEMAKIIDVGIANGDLGYIVQRGIILVAMAMLALFFGVQAGNMAAVAAAGYAKNLRHDIFYKVQDFSFKNIDHFSTSGLVTRMTTDITNVQMAYMMSIRLLARAPIMILLSWISWEHPSAAPLPRSLKPPAHFFACSIIAEKSFSSPIAPGIWVHPG